MPIDCDANSLSVAARCFAGLPGPVNDRIILYLLCQIANNGGGGGGGTGGVVPLAAGVNSGTGTFSAPFAAAPDVVVVSVRDSSDTQVLSASVVDITAAGFTFNLTGFTETANCSLHYIVVE